MLQATSEFCFRLVGCTCRVNGEKISTDFEIVCLDVINKYSLLCWCEPQANIKTPRVSHQKNNKYLILLKIMVVLFWF